MFNIMNVWATNIIVYAKEGLDDMISETLDINNSDTNVNTYQENDAIYGPFQLPINYVDKETLHELSPIVTEDLELVESKGKKQTALAKQAVDLALLSHGLLKGKNLSEFVERSFELIKS